MRRHTRWIPVTLTLFALGACGGGGGSGGGSTGAGAPTQPTPTATPVSSEGVITGFGSVYVNDVRYELDDDTQVVADDETRVGDDSILSVGMKVRIDATEEDGRRIAARIEHRRDLKGPVTRITIDAEDPSIGSFFVANTRVIADANTVYGDGFDDRDGNGDIDIRDLTVDSGRLVVAVSGFAGADGYLASRISRVSGNDDDDDDLDLKGFVTAVDLDGSTFTVSGTTFAVTGATDFEDDLVFDETLVGVFVDVDAVLVDGVFEARDVDRGDDVDDDDRRGRFEIEGILLSVDVDSDPDLVQIGNRTLEVQDASALVDLVGSKVKVKGSFDDAGVLVIDRIRSREQDQQVRTEDRVMSVDAAGGTFTTRLGLVIRPEPTTRLEDDDDDDDRISPDDFLTRLRSNDYVEARGALEDDGTVRWTKIEREDDDVDEEECMLRGPVAAIAADQSSFEILGVTIDVAPGRDVDFEDDDDDIGRDEFFRRLSVGRLVEAESDDDDVNACQDGLMLADDVELEDDDQPFPPSGGQNGGTGGGTGDGDPGSGSGSGTTVFLIIDEDSIDNGNPPNDFSAEDVNDQLAAVGLRTPLAFFEANVGARIDLFTGQLGDEGWFALTTVPATWQQAGPTDNGLRNYLTPGPGLGVGEDPEVLLDEIPAVTPLRATGLAMLRGETVCALVYDGDVGINYSPLTGNLQGANLGIVAFEVLSAAERSDGSDSELPRMTVDIRDPGVCDGPLYLFDNAPVAESSSEPFDVTPPSEPPAPRLLPAS